MINHNYKILLSLVPLTILLIACGTPNSSTAPSTNAGSTPYTVTEDYNLGVISYTVQRGDRLGTIAQEFTGRTSNWREIAEYNSISNPRNLQEGTVLNIPTDLIPNYQRPATVPVIESRQATTTEAQSSALAVRRNNADEVPVVVTPIVSNRDFELTPIDPNVPAPTQSYNGEGKQIKVVGSYYPIGIYTEPAGYSKLLMRASPGTLFVLDSQVNDWYKIDTTTGSGYIRISDAAIVN